MKQIEGGVDNYFKCQLRFQQEGRDEEHIMKVIREFQSEEVMLFVLDMIYFSKLAT